MTCLSLTRVMSVIGIALAFTAARAQDDAAARYPERPVHLIVGYAAGGANDIVARHLGQRLADRLGQPFVVENKPGAAGIIGTEYVAKAAKDGYTLLFAPSSIFTTNPVMFRSLPYTSGDFAPITSVVTYPFFLIVSAGEPIHSVQELAAYLKSNPKRANFAGAAGIFQLGFELLKSQTGTTGEYIAYKGTNLSVNAVIAGEVLMTMADGGPASVALRSGKVRGLAVTADSRVPTYPDIPTVREAGFPDLKMGSWMGVFAPAGTPAPIVRKLEDEIARIVGSEEFKEKMATLQVNADAIRSERFGKMIDSDLERWRAVAKAGQIEPTN